MGDVATFVTFQDHCRKCRLTNVSRGQALIICYYNGLLPTLTCSPGMRGSRCHPNAESSEFGMRSADWAHSLVSTICRLPAMGTNGHPAPQQETDPAGRQTAIISARASRHVRRGGRPAIAQASLARTEKAGRRAGWPSSPEVMLWA